VIEESTLYIQRRKTSSRSLECSSLRLPWGIKEDLFDGRLVVVVFVLDIGSM